MAGKRPRTSMRKNTRLNRRIAQGKDRKHNGTKSANSEETNHNSLPAQKTYLACDIQGEVAKIYGDKKIFVMSYHRGTHFPCASVIKYEDWIHNKSIYEKFIISSLYNGKSLADLALEQEALLDKMEKFMFDWGKNHPSGLIKGHLIQKDLVEFMGKEWFGNHWEKDVEEKFDMLKNVWFMAVYTLIRLGVKKDDDRHGWVIMDEDAGEWMKSM